MQPQLGFEPAAGLPSTDLEQAFVDGLAVAPAEFTTTAAIQMESVLRRLDALEQDATKTAAAKDKEKKPADGWTDLSAEKWTVKLGGHVQMDYIHWPYADPPVPPSNYFEFRRLRLVADGTGYGLFDFRLQIDIEPESGDGVTVPVVDVKDAYFSMNEMPVVHRWRIGNFFVPFSLEQVTNDTNNIFLERSIPTQGIFAADREVGMAMYGVTESQNVTWTVGVFFDSISESLKERIDDNQGTRVSGRVTWLPLLRRAVERPLSGPHRRGRALHRQIRRSSPLSHAPADSRRAVPHRQRHSGRQYVHDRQHRAGHGVGPGLGAERGVRVERQHGRWHDANALRRATSTAATS